MPLKLYWLTVLLVSLVCKSEKFHNVNFPQIIEHQTPDFYRTFIVNFAVFTLNQDGDRNREKVY